MASSTKFVCFFFLFTTLLSSPLKTHARDSHFFSKVTRNRDETTNPNHNYYNNQENVAIPFSKQQEKEEQPNFIPQTTQNHGYGLYGHETGLDSPSTSTSTNTATPTTYNMDDNKYENQNNFNNYDNFENNQEEKNYDPKLEGLSGTSYTNNNNFNNVAPRKFVGENNYYNKNNNGEGKYYYGGVGYNGGVEKQGISDTKYLENGKYFYDINDEKKFDPINSNDFSYNNNFNNNNNLDNNNLNNNNYYNSGKGMYPGYQNLFPKEEEFDFDDQP